jgi:hypothetical protein
VIAARREVPDVSTRTEDALRYSRRAHLHPGGPTGTGDGEEGRPADWAPEGWS